MFSSNPCISILHDGLSNINNMDKNTPIVFVQKSFFFLFFNYPTYYAVFQMHTKNTRVLEIFHFESIYKKCCCMLSAIFLFSRVTPLIGVNLVILLLL